jgi:tetratricopeptide (TPR) repeat protein
VLVSLGLCYRDLGDISEAEAHFRRAIALEERLGRFECLADSLIALGNCRECKEDFADARRCYVRALGLYQRMGLTDSHKSVEKAKEALARLPAEPAN